MHGRLTYKELRIIEQTKREGAELHERENGERQDGPKKGGRRTVVGYIILILAFFLLAFGAKLMVSLFS